MIKKFSSITALILCCSCSTNLLDNNTLIEQRSPIAQALEAKQHYAEALTQWKIIQAAYPNDSVVTGQVARLEFLISDLVINQLAILDRAKSSRNQNLARKVYLRILALDPNNEIAIQELQKFEWQFALKEANSKTETIKQYFVESQNKAKQSIKLTQFLEQGEQFSHDKKFSRLLQLADKFEQAYPSHPQPNTYRILAYTKLAEAEQKQDSPERAIEYYQQAIKVTGIDGNTVSSLSKKTEQIKGALANKYFKLANREFKSDLDAAIKYFELTLKYQPNHSKAQQLLLRAVTMRDNLNRIKKLNANSG